MSSTVFVLLDEQRDPRTHTHTDILIGVYTTVERAKEAATKDAEGAELKWREFWWDGGLSLLEMAPQGERYCIHRSSMDE